MSLLEIITKASSTIAAPSNQDNYPIVLNPEPILIELKPEANEEQPENPVKKVVGWEISKADGELIELGQNFVKNLRKKLNNKKTFKKDEFIGMLTSHLEKISEKVGISVPVDRSEQTYTLQFIEKLGFSMSRDAKVLVLEGCVGLEIWDVLESLISNGLVEHSTISYLVNSLIEKCKSDTIILCLKKSLDLQAYDLMCILKYFLVLPVDGHRNLVTLREAWEGQALLAIEKANGKGVTKKEKSLAKNASLLVMLGHDGFSVSELCLHYLFATKNFDEVIFSACIGKLNGDELKALINYLGKWLRKYERFPQVCPCPEASSVLGLRACDWIPPLGNIVKCLSLVVDQHFSSLVMNSDRHEELKLLEGVVNLLAAETMVCGTLANLTGRLKTELNA